MASGAPRDLSGRGLSGLIAAAKDGRLPGSKPLKDDPFSISEQGAPPSHSRGDSFAYSRAFAPLEPRFDRIGDAVVAVRDYIMETLAAVDDAASSRSTGIMEFGPNVRPLVAEDNLILLDPSLNFAQTRQIRLTSLQQRMILSRARSGRDELGRMLNPEMLALAEPRIIRTSRPRMERMCVPSPHIAVSCHGESSTAGVFCRDASGVLGVTACFHGTGPTGTTVTVGLRECVVGSYNPVQDIVFIPLPAGYNLPPMIGRNLTAPAAQPSRGQQASFEGATSGATSTWIDSWDEGLMRRRATIQLKVQTAPDANKGDSGTALVDGKDCVMAFAFERTAYGEHPEFADWIWANNALAALGLTPV